MTPDRHAGPLTGACETCAFYYYGECRRFPPHFRALSTGGAYTRTEAQGLWPQVKEKDWCGEYAGRAILSANDAGRLDGERD